MDLVGKTIRHGMANIIVLSIEGNFYNCTDKDTGKTFQALRSRYDDIFMPPVAKVKKKGSKGKHISGSQYLDDED
jgi:hypothetical protein